MEATSVFGPLIVPIVTSLLVAAGSVAASAAWLNRRHIARLTDAQAMHTHAQARGEDADTAQVYHGMMLDLVKAAQARAEWAEEELDRERDLHVRWTRMLQEAWAYDHNNPRIVVVEEASVEQAEPG